MLGIGRFHDGRFEARVAHRAVFADLADAQCTAAGWSHRPHWVREGLTEFRAVEFNDDDDVVTVHPQKGCPKR